MERHSLYRSLCEGQVVVCGFQVTIVPYDAQMSCLDDSCSEQVRYNLVCEMYLLVFSDDVRGELCHSLLETRVSTVW